MTFKCNDLELVEALHLVSKNAGNLDRLLRDNDRVGLWKALEIIHNRSQVGMHRLLSLNSEQS